MSARVVATERQGPDDSVIPNCAFPYLLHTNILWKIAKPTPLHRARASPNSGNSQGLLALDGASESCIRIGCDPVYNFPAMTEWELPIIVCHAAGTVARVTGWHGPGYEYFIQSWRRNLSESSGGTTMESTRPVPTRKSILHRDRSIIVRVPPSSSAIVTQLIQTTSLWHHGLKTHDRL